MNSEPSGSYGWRARLTSADGLGGLAFLAIAMAGYFAAEKLPGLRGFQFGPGTAPRIFGVSLAIASAVLLVSAMLSKAPVVPERLSIRAPACVIGAMVVFALGLSTLGLLISGFLVVMLSSAASNEVRWLEATVFATIFSVVSGLLFVVALKLPFPLWPAF